MTDDFYDPAKPNQDLHSCELPEIVNPFTAPGPPTKGWFNENIVSILAFIVVAGGGVCYICAPAGKDTFIASIITAVVSYYYGSSMGSRDKDQTIAKQMESNTNQEVGK